MSNKRSMHQAALLSTKQESGDNGTLDKRIKREKHAQRSSRRRDSDEEGSGNDEDDEDVPMLSSRVKQEKYEADDDEEEEEEEEEEEKEEEDEGDEGDEDQLQELRDLKLKEMGHQSKEEEREIRSKYRSLSMNLDENRLEFINPSSDALHKEVEKVNQVYNQVKKTNEANMDSHILVKVGDLGLQRIQNMKFDNSSFDVEDFLERIATKIGATGEDRARNDLINNMNLNWTPLALISEKYLKRCPTADFMLGPVALPPKQVKQRKTITHAKERNTTIKQAQELKEEDIQRQENETSSNVSTVMKTLRRRPGKTNLFRFVINPRSFSQTVENVFYLSFLVKDGMVKIETDQKTGEIFVSANVDNDDDDGSSEPLKTQLILSIDKKLFKDAIELYKITETIIPHRQPVHSAANSNKWYG